MRASTRRSRSSPADPLLFEPGTEYHYSTYGWILVSAVVERAAAEPFARFMVREVFEPLAMERTIVAETEGLDASRVISVQLAGEPARMVSHRGSPMGGIVSLLTFPDVGLAIAGTINEIVSSAP